MTIASELERAGLTDKEVSAYLVLLRFGTRSTTFIAKRAELNRGTAYFALHSLLEKGLVTKAVRQKIQYFTPLEPKQLLSYLSRTEEQIRQHSQKIAELMPQLQALCSVVTSRPRIEFFEGIEGARNVLELTVKSEEKLLRAYLSLADIIDYVGEEFFDRYTNSRIQAGIHLNVIRAAGKDKEAFARHSSSRKYLTSKKDRRSVRHIGASLAFPISTYIFEDKIAVISSRDEDFSMLMQSREMSAMQRNLFDFIWSGLKDEKPGR